VTSQVRRAAPFIPNDEWFVLRVLTFLTGALLLVVASTGLLSEKLFAAPTTTKYLVTVAASAMLVLIATERAPVRLVVFFGVLTVPLSFVFSFAGLQPSPLIAVDLLALLMALPQRLKSHARLAKMAPAYALLLLPGILGSNDPGYYFVWVGVTLGTGWLAYVVARGVGGTQLIVAGLTLVAVAEGALAIYEFKTGTQFNLYGSALNNTLSASYYFSYGDFFRPAATLPDPIALGQLLCLCLPITAAYAATLTNRWLAVLTALAAGITTLGLVLSLDRASIVGGAAGLALTLGLLPRGVRARGVALTLVVLAIVVLSALSIAPHALNDRIASIFHPTSAHVVTSQGDLLRLRQWRAALKTFEANPVTGVGFGRIQNWLPLYGADVSAGGQAQSVWLQVMAEAGILGLCAIVGSVVAAILDLVAGFGRNRVLVAGLAGGLLASLVAWTTDWELRYESMSSVLAVAFGVIAAIADDAYDHKNVATRG
jgi:hypothetical protein